MAVDLLGLQALDKATDPSGRDETSHLGVTGGLRLHQGQVGLQSGHPCVLVITVSQIARSDLGDGAYGLTSQSKSKLEFEVVSKHSCRNICHCVRTFAESATVR